MSSILAPYPSLSSTSLDALTLIKTIRTLLSDAPQTLILKHAIADAIKTIWAVMCGIAGIALIASLGVKGYKLDQALSGGQGFVDGDRSNGAMDESERDGTAQMTPQPSEIAVEEKGGTRR
jgi:hypothetical protein